MNKTILAFFVVSFLCLSTLSNAQLNPKTGMDSLLQQKFLLNFMVPDVPAFQALDNNPSEMLKPSAPRDLAVMFSSFRSGNQFIIPKSFAAEFAPGLFASTKITLKDYQTKYVLRMLTKTRLSLATKFDDQSTFNHIAGGIKFTLIDKGDYRSDTAFLNAKVYSKLAEYEKLVSDKKLEYMKSHNLTAIDFANNESLGEEIEDSIKLHLIQTDIRTSVEEYKRSHWNSSRMELTYATVASSTDTILKNASINHHIFWLTYAIKPGKNCNWAQIIFGLNNQLIRNGEEAFTNQFCLNSRAYFGSNKSKGFAEIQYKNRSNTISSIPKSSMLLNLGIDMDIYSGIWIHLAGGVDNLLGKNGRSQLVGNMKIYVSLPENFKLF